MFILRLIIWTTPGWLWAVLSRYVMIKKPAGKDDDRMRDANKIWCPAKECFQYVKACHANCKKKHNCISFKDYIEPKLFWGGQYLQRHCFRRRYYELASAADTSHPFFPARGNGQDNLDFIAAFTACLDSVFCLSSCRNVCLWFSFFCHSFLSF